MRGQVTGLHASVDHELMALIACAIAGKSVPVGAVDISGDPVVGLIGSSSSGDVEGTLVSCTSGAVLASVRVPWSGNSLNSSQPTHQAHLQYAVAGPATDLDALRYAHAHDAGIDLRNAQQAALQARPCDSYLSCNLA